MVPTISAMRTRLDNTLFKSDFARSVTVREIQQTLDPQTGSPTGDPTNVDTVETAAIMVMKREQQQEIFGNYRPDRLNSYFRYDSVMTQFKFVVIDSLVYKAESFHEVKKSADIVMFKAILIKVN